MQMQNDANECKYQDVPFLFSLDGRTWERAEVEQTSNYQPTGYASDIEYVLSKKPEQIKYTSSDFKADLADSLADVGGVLRAVSSGLIRQIPGLIRFSIRLLSGFGYVVYWVGYGLLMLIGGLLSAFIFPSSRGESAYHPSGMDSKADVQVDVNVKVNVR